MRPQAIVNESHQKIEVNLEKESERVDRREPTLPVRESHKPNSSGKNMSEGAHSLVMLATKSNLREFCEDPTTIPLMLMYKGNILVSNDMTPLSIGGSNMLQEFSYMFPEEVPLGLPPLQGIEHQIDLILGAPLPNRAPYRTNPEEKKEIRNKYKRFSTKVIFV
jgi:hypothetical protein